MSLELSRSTWLVTSLDDETVAPEPNTIRAAELIPDALVTLYNDVTWDNTTVMTGDLASIIQEVGNDKLVYYKMTVKLNNVRTGIVEWTDEKEIRKKFEKKHISW